MTKEEYEKEVEALLPKHSREIMRERLDTLSNFGVVVIHDPTGISGYSVEDVTEKAKKHYQKIIDRHLSFTHVMKVKL